MWGTASVQNLCRAAKRLGYHRFALTDTNNLYGLVTFLKMCKQEGCTPIVGAELTSIDGRKRAVCLVETEQGYRNLCRLITRRHMDRAFDFENALISHASGLKVLTKHPDLLTTWHAAGVRIGAAMPRTPLPPGHRLRRTARRLGVPLVATPGNFFIRPEGFRIHRLLRAVAKNTVLSRLDPGDIAPTDAWLASADTYCRRFSISPDAIKATRQFAESLTFTGPEFKAVPPPWKDPKGRKTIACLWEAAYEGARDRYGRELSKPIVDRLELELRVIADMDFAGYFLVVRDIVKLSPRICGRGSAAASLVAYSLKITNICPVKHNLYFERFLNPGRTDPPDIDIDFAWDERDDILRRVLKRFQGHAAMVANHVCFQPRMAVRETAKVFGLSDAEIGNVTKRLPWHWCAETYDSDFLTWLSRRPEAKALDFPEPWPEILHLAQQLIGTPRHLSVHPGGIVITPDPIDTYVPIEKTPKGIPIIQWEKESTESAGLVKIDLLGNRSLGVIRDAVKNMAANRIPFSETRWEPEDDFATRDTISQGRTMGCFYIESPAMRLLQQKSGVGDFEHLVIHSSIIRPAANEFIQEYLRRLHGGHWDPIHPLLADVLGETFGIMVYQEDVSRAAVAVAGFSHAEADRLRKMLSKKDHGYELGDFRNRFFDGARPRRVTEAKITEIWNMMMSFNGYSFCKPHSASYARVSFQAAYLKTHHSAEFMSAVISNGGGFYSPFAYVSEARRLGLSILPPDVMKSEIRWTGKNKAIRVGLLSIKGLAAQTRTRIIAERRKNPFQGLKDFFMRIRPGNDEAKALIRSGALDSICPGINRTVMMWELAVWQQSRSKSGKNTKLFDNRLPDTPPPLPPESESDRLRREFSVLGFLCDRHPMSLFRAALCRAKTVRVTDLPHCIGKRVRLGAWIVTGKVVHTKHGDLMEFLTFEDETGIVETTFFPQAYRRFCHMIDAERPYLLSGKVDQNWGAVTLTVENVELLKRSQTITDAADLTSHAV
jgi:error-prone DNA polymerase